MSSNETQNEPTDSALPGPIKQRKKIVIEGNGQRTNPLNLFINDLSLEKRMNNMSFKMNKKTQTKHKMSSILSYNKAFLKNNLPFFSKLIKIIKESDNSIVINESSGSGKTFYFDTLPDLANSTWSAEIKSITTQDNEMSLKESFQDVVSIRFCLRYAFDRSVEDGQFNEVLFTKNLNNRLIEQIESKIYIDETLKIDLGKFKKDIEKPPERTTKRYLVWNQTNIYSTILCYMMERIGEGYGLYKNKNSIANTSYNDSSNQSSPDDEQHISNGISSKGNKIKKIICLVDEANIFVSKNVYSYLFDDDGQYRNFMIKVIQDAYLYEREGHYRKNMIFILSSIIPFSLKRRSEYKGLKLIDFTDMICNETIEWESFAELKPSNFIDMAGPSDAKEDNNILRKIVNDVKKEEISMLDYMSDSMSDETKDHLEDIWIEILTGTEFDKENDEKNKERLILLGIYNFLSYLGRQPLFIFKKKIQIF